MYGIKVLVMQPVSIFFEGFVSWTLVCGCSNIQHFMMAVNFSELANSLRVLLEYSSKEWSLDHIISIVDELTST